MVAILFVYLRLHSRFNELIMPQQTFNNLKPERQKEIRDIAYKEFSLNDYKNASVSNIVKELSLAKGSFYRYFNSKLDLYTYLLEFAIQLRMSTVNQLIQEETDDFFAILKENFSNKIDFDFQYPLESIFTYRVLLENNTPELKEIINNLKLNILKLVEDLIKHFIDSGKLRKDINVSITAFNIYHMQVGLFEYLSIKKEIDFVKNIQEGKSVFSIEKSEIMEVVNNMIELLKAGMQNRQC